MSDRPLILVTNDDGIFAPGISRLAIRPSGTEPVVRVMVEGQDSSLVQAVATDLALAVQSI